MQREKFNPCFRLTCTQLLKHYFIEADFQEALQSPLLLLLLLLEAIPLESDTCVFPIELEFKASEGKCIWKPQHGPLPLNC